GVELMTPEQVAGSYVQVVDRWFVRLRPVEPGDLPRMYDLQRTRTRTGWRARSPGPGRRSTRTGRSRWATRPTAPGRAAATMRWAGTFDAARWRARITSATGSAGRFGGKGSPVVRCNYYCGRSPGVR